MSLCIVMFVNDYEQTESRRFPSPESSVVPACSTGALPAREDYPGPYKFSVLLESASSSKNKYTYSVAMNKLYITWDKVIPIQFKWASDEPGLSVRALPVYTDSQDMQTPVTRCFLHSSACDPSNKGFNEVSHVIRCESSHAIYDYNPDSERTSVVIPLGPLQPGTCAATIMYKFMCKTSCNTGMMRRPITVLFTLERSNGEVVGRQKLNVKICCCPKRDRIKDEEAIQVKQENGLPQKRLLSDLPRYTKKLKLDPRPTLVVELSDPSLQYKILETVHGVVLSMLRREDILEINVKELETILHKIEAKLLGLEFRTEKKE